MKTVAEYVLEAELIERAIDCMWGVKIRIRMTPRFLAEPLGGWWCH